MAALARGAWLALSALAVVEEEAMSAEVELPGGFSGGRPPLRRDAGLYVVYR